MIVETSDNRLFDVKPAGDGLDHCYIGVPVKRVAGSYVPKAKARERLVSKRHIIRVVAE